MSEFEKRLACVISANGDVVRGYRIYKCRFDGTNRYTISWQIPLQGVAKTNFAATIGSALGEAAAPGLITVGLGEDPVEMHVHTFGPGGKPAPRSFHIACFRELTRRITRAARLPLVAPSTMAHPIQTRSREGGVFPA